LALVMAHVHTLPSRTPSLTAGIVDEKAKDPICGMVIGKAGAIAAGLTAERGGRTYYFCSPACKHTFEDPERELKSMRTRVGIALSGVLALAIQSSRVPGARGRSHDRELGADPRTPMVHLGHVALLARDPGPVHRRLELLQGRVDGDPQPRDQHGFPDRARYQPIWWCGTIGAPS
jgi:YHS domain-containing protein